VDSFRAAGVVVDVREIRMKTLSMPQRQLGSRGPSVSAIGLGCTGISDFHGAGDSRQSIAAIHRAIDIGVTFLDAADAYGPFTNERLVGRAIKGRRDQVLIATKFGILRADDGKWIGLSGRPDYVRQACDDSLQRLGVDVIDLYYQHRVDPKTPVEDTVGAMAELVKTGKVRYLGLSEAPPAIIRRAHAVHPISALQVEYSLWSREPERELLATCRALGIALVAHSPFGRGSLTGPFRLPDDFARNFALTTTVQQLARVKNCTPAQLALAWLLARGMDVIPIPDSTRVARVEENAGAVDVHLSTDDLVLLDTIAPGVARERYQATACVQ
jgi:aryl-alcohol dehydrogenase-like predicted oxidoreductase